MPDPTLNGLFQHAVQNHPRPDMFRFKQAGKWVDVSTEQFEAGVQHLSEGLVALGVEPGDRVALLSENRLEWAMADLAALGAGASVVPIYPTLLPQQIRFLLQDSQPKVAFCSSMEQVDKLRQLRSRQEIPFVKHIVSFDAVDRAEVLTLDKVRQLGEVGLTRDAQSYQKRVAQIDPASLATIIYTSGTTGDPKGVMLTHRNIAQNVLSVLKVLPMGTNDRCLSFLPLSHIFERMAGHYTMIYAGVSISFAESIETVAENMTEVHPTVVISVPRLYEKIYARVLTQVEVGSSMKRKIFWWARGTGERVSEMKRKGKSPGALLGMKAKLSDRLVFKKMRARTGGSLRFFVSGGAPLNREIAEFFFAAGLPILEGYGLTETSPVITVNTFENCRPGTVGKPVPGVEVRIADDGEVLTRSASVMAGYYENPSATAEAIQDGWFHTGDIGHLDDDGFLVITDRKKDIIVTAGGKNIAPQPIENELKNHDLVGEVSLIGDHRKYMVALIAPNFESLVSWAQQRGLDAKRPEVLVQDERVRAAFQVFVDQVNATRPSYEQIKRFALLESELTLENDELTPTLKVKRRVIQTKYADLIEGLYELDEPSPAS